MGDFQTVVNTVQAPAVEGDFCDSNPRATVDAGPGGLVCGPLGVTVARFAWLSSAQIDADNAPSIANNYGVGPVAGFVHREQQGLITQYLQTASMLVPKGFGITLFRKGGFWVRNAGSGQALRGQKAYAKYADGSVRFGVTGAPLSANITAQIDPKTSNITGSIAGNVMTVTAAAGDAIVVGQVLAGAGVASGTKVSAQLSGTPGGIGTYSMNIPEQAVPAATAITGTYGLLTVTVAASGGVTVGSVVAGAGVTNGTAVRSLGTGVGGVGTYFVDLTQTVASEAMTVTSDVETDYEATSSGAAGELVKMSNVAPVN